MMKFPKFLRLAILTNEGIFETNSSNKQFVQITGGLESKLLSFIRDGLKFQYTAVIPEDMEWGTLKDDGNWTGVVGMVSRNEADIGLGTVGMFYDRLSAVDFSYPYSVQDFCFATKAPGFLSKETAEFRPFSAQVWITFLVALIMVTSAFKFLMKAKFQDMLFYVLRTTLLSAPDLRVSSIREKILVAIWLFSAMFLSYGYRAVLLSFLTIPLKEKPISDKYKLLEVLDKGDYKCFAPKGSFVLSALLSSPDRASSAIAKHIIKNNWFLDPTKETIEEFLEKRNAAFIALRSNFRTALPENVYIPEDVFFTSRLTIVVKKRFCCLQSLDEVIHRITAAGLYEKSINDYHFKLRLQKLKNSSLPETSRIKSLVLADLIGPIIILFAGYILGMITLVFETIFSKRAAKHDCI